MAKVARYLSLVKFSHTVFALPFALIGFFLGLESTHSGFEPILFVKVMGCMVTARTAAMAFNRYADRSYDSLNERTRGRELPSGAINPSSAFFLVALSSFVFIAITFTINSICFWLSPVALAVILGYSLTKRFTSLCHLILGLGLSLAPIGAYLAVTGRFDFTPLLFSGAVLSWVGGFDIIYSLQDDTFDRSQRLHSIPASLGRKNALMVSSLLHLVCAGLLLIAG
ncbi:MAG: UbiA-like polyprenyltransferase, partial [Flavobacteriales bacterium]